MNVSIISKLEMECIGLFDARMFAEFLEKSKDVSGWRIGYYRYVCYCRGFGVDRDLVKAHELISNVYDEMLVAAKAGDGWAMNSLGVIAEGVPGDSMRDIGRAVEWYRKSAMKGFAKGQCNYARCCEKGMGVRCDLSEAVKWYEAAVAQGDNVARLDYARMLARGNGVERDIARVADLIRKSAAGGHPIAQKMLSVMGEDQSDERIFVEVLVDLALLRNSSRRPTASVSDVSLSIRTGRDAPSKPSEKDNGGDYGDSWLLANKPQGTEIPSVAGRAEAKTPNLLRFNTSFAGRLIKYVRDRFGGDAPAVYRAAHISRKTYSSIVSSELRPVSKRTAVQFVFALRLTPEEAGEMLKAAGFAFSPAILEDMIFSACLEAKIYDLGTVNSILSVHGAKPFSTCAEKD